MIRKWHPTSTTITKFKKVKFCFQAWRWGQCNPKWAGGPTPHNPNANFDPSNIVTRHTALRYGGAAVTFEGCYAHKVRVGDCPSSRAAMEMQPYRTAERLGAARSPAGEAAAEKKANAEAVPATVEGDSGAKRSRASTAVTAANIATTSSQAKLPAAKNAGQVRRVLCASRLPRRVGFGSSRLHRPSLRTPAGIDAASPTGPSATTPAGTQRDSSSRRPC